MIEVTENSPVVWIPCFKGKSKLLIDKPNVLSDLVISNKDKKFQIGSISEDTEFQMNYDSDYKNSAKLEVKSSDCVLDSKFYMAIVHYSIVNNFNIPSIFTLICDHDNWIQLDN